MVFYFFNCVVPEILKIYLETTERKHFYSTKSAYFSESCSHKRVSKAGGIQVSKSRWKLDKETC
jgi:hypothetical protein